MRNINLHPTTLMLVYIGLALGMGWFPVGVLWGLTGLALGLMAWSGFKQCWRMLRRARLLFLLMVLVYGFMTPGVAQIPAWGTWSPSVPGVELGLIHAWRLALLLALLATLLHSLDRMQLLAGIYQLLSPLQLLGVPVQRIAVRLWLTLHYFEVQPRPRAMAENWKQALALPAQSMDQVELSMPGFTRQDWVFGLMSTALIGWALW